MTERRPPHVPAEDRVERQIREAQARGAFDGLPGAGKPLPGLDAHWSADRWAHEWARREGADLEAALPLPLQLRREKERLLSGLDDVAREADVRERLEHFNDAVRDGYRRPVVSGPPMTVGLVDVEATVADWRRRRAERVVPGDAPPRPDRAQPSVRSRRGWWRRRSTGGSGTPRG